MEDLVQYLKKTVYDMKPLEVRNGREGGIIDILSRRSVFLSAPPRLIPIVYSMWLICRSLHSGNREFISFDSLLPCVADIAPR